MRRAPDIAVALFAWCLVMPTPPKPPKDGEDTSAVAESETAPGTDVGIAAEAVAAELPTAGQGRTPAVAEAQRTTAASSSNAAASSSGPVPPPMPVTKEGDEDGGSPSGDEDGWIPAIQSLTGTRMFLP